jgi:hypothetical protein
MRKIYRLQICIYCIYHICKISVKSYKTLLMSKFEQALCVWPYAVFNLTPFLQYEVGEWLIYSVKRTIFHQSPHANENLFDGEPQNLIGLIDCLFGKRIVYSILILAHDELVKTPCFNRSLIKLKCHTGNFNSFSGIILLPEFTIKHNYNDRR